MRAENLESLSLNNNYNIGGAGCYALPKGNWTKISLINLGNYI